MGGCGVFASGVYFVASAAEMGGFCWGRGGKSISIGKYALARRFFYFRINGWRGYVREALQGMFD